MNAHSLTQFFAPGWLHKASSSNRDAGTSGGGALLLVFALLALAMFANVINGHPSLEDGYLTAGAIGGTGATREVLDCANCAKVQQIRVLHLPRSADGQAWDASSLFGPGISAYTGNAGGYLSNFDRRYRVTLHMPDGSTRTTETGLPPQFAVGDEVMLTDGGRILFADHDM